MILPFPAGPLCSLRQQEWARPVFRGCCECTLVKKFRVSHPLLMLLTALPSSQHMKRTLEHTVRSRLVGPASVRGGVCISAGFTTLSMSCLTLGKSRAVSALVKRGYSSGMAYISVIKCVSRQLGLHVHHFTHFQCQRAVRSLFGEPVHQPDRTHRFHWTSWHPCLKPDGPWTSVLAILWRHREIETAALVCDDVSRAMYIAWIYGMGVFAITWRTKCGWRFSSALFYIWPALK